MAEAKIEIKAIDPAERMFGRGQWDKNRGLQPETFSEALKRAHAAQEDDKPKEEKTER